MDGPEPSTLCVGWREWVALPQLEIPAIKAKIDTGALSSCIHARDIRSVCVAGEDYLAFEVTPLREHSSFVLHCKARIIDERNVRSSNGVVTLRPFVRTMLAVGGRQWSIELSLADRREMKFPALLGRQALRGQVMVQPGGSYILGRKLPHCYRDHGLPKKKRKRA